MKSRKLTPNIISKATSLYVGSDKEQSFFFFLFKRNFLDISFQIVAFLSLFSSPFFFCLLFQGLFFGERGRVKRIFYAHYIYFFLTVIIMYKQACLWLAFASEAVPEKKVLCSISSVPCLKRGTHFRAFALMAFSSSSF